ncbi:Ferredoxin--NADP(+) reductase protein [Dioscorea alata]|uniref:Ferredoxin--NADP(+) reductase protein n=1 Tax=Dioscorea alata TaxID=55571 RepID=A0ACB7V6A5_DIOAL|nr:Ferredoxin--NADP(+) reductase protein [Dioscorea alata]
MALKADLCSVMHAEMIPAGKGLGFNYSGSSMFSNLNFRNDARTSLPGLSLRNQKQYSKYNTSVQKVAEQNAVLVKPLKVEDGPLLVKDRFIQVEEAKEPTLTVPRQGQPCTTRVVSVDTLVGPRGAVGEICHIVLDHGGNFHFVEGQYLGVILPPNNGDGSGQSRSRVKFDDYSVASCRDGDAFDGKTLSLCVRRAELSPDGVSNFLCDRQEGDEVDIIGPFGYEMVWPTNLEAKHIMVATSTGIAPFRSNLKQVFVNPNSRVTFNGLAWLIAGADNYNSLLYNGEFTQILMTHPVHFRYQKALADHNTSVADVIYQNGDQIFSLLNGGAYIYFAGLQTMMPEILKTFERIAQERGEDWTNKLAELERNDQWRVEVY